MDVTQGTKLTEALTELSERQHSLVARRQGQELGLTRAAWRWRTIRPDWDLLSPRVARRTGSPSTPEQRALAAVLDVGPSAYVSHASAAALWGIPGFTVQPVHVIVVRGGRQVPSSLAITHRPRHLPDPFGTELDGIPVVRPALLLLQLAAEVRPARLRRILDRMWDRRLLSGPSVARELAPLMHRGRDGTAPLREVLDGLPTGYVPSASSLEARAEAVLREAGLGPFRRQVDLGDGGRWCGRVDLLHESLPVVVEIDSDKYHAALTDAADDLARDLRLERAGFTVVRVQEAEVWHRPSAAVAKVRAALAGGRRRAA